MFSFSKSGQKRFIAVGIPGMVGILSGMVPGAYSVTIDWAPPTTAPSFHFGPTFLLRTVLESCGSYEAAVDRLCHERLSTSTFFTVCGAEKGCIIERTHDDYAVRELAQHPISVSNHFQSPKFVHHNDQLTDLEKEDELLRTTRTRSCALQDALSALPPEALDLASLKATLHTAPVTNNQTVQRMLFVPATGTLLVDRRA